MFDRILNSFKDFSLQDLNILQRFKNLDSNNYKFTRTSLPEAKELALTTSSASQFKFLNIVECKKKKTKDESKFAELIIRTYIKEIKEEYKNYYKKKYKKKLAKK
ncbi:hypothetical protein HZS_7204 [Henneguya salminicola]|nr:hypothetical protein HZS_7204 [Henneguya salminicola]